MYISWYGFGRMFIEGLRTDSLYVGVFRISQVVGFACFVVGTILLIYNLSKVRRAAITDTSYEPAYPKFAHGSNAQESNDAEAEKELAKEETTVENTAFEKRLNDLLGDTEKNTKDEEQGE
jgi:hypothetical protein